MQRRVTLVEYQILASIVNDFKAVVEAMNAAVYLSSAGANHNSPRRSSRGIGHCAQHGAILKQVAGTSHARQGCQCT